MNTNISVSEQDKTVSCLYDSSNIKSTLYHTDTQHLVVEFARGNKVTYHPVDLDTHRKMILAESIGKEFVKLVQKNSAFKFLNGDREKFEEQQNKK